MANEVLVSADVVWSFEDLRYCLEAHVLPKLKEHTLHMRSIRSPSDLDDRELMVMKGELCLSFLTPLAVIRCEDDVLQWSLTGLSVSLFLATHPFMDARTGPEMKRM